MASPPLSTPSRTTERVFDRCGQPGRAWNDVSEGLRQWELWGVLGLQDIRQRYRRSILGPFWVTLSMGMMIGGLGVIYSTIFKTSDAFYVPYLATGLIVWTLITGLIADGCICFSGGGEWIKQLPAPLCSYVFRMIWRNLIIFCHNMVIYFVVIVAYAMWPGFANLLLAGTRDHHYLYQWILHRSYPWGRQCTFPRHSADGAERSSGGVFCHPDNLERIAVARACSNRSLQSTRLFCGNCAGTIARSSPGPEYMACGDCNYRGSGRHSSHLFCNAPAPSCILGVSS